MYHTTKNFFDGSQQARIVFRYDFQPQFRLMHWKIYSTRKFLIPPFVSLLHTYSYNKCIRRPPILQVFNPYFPTYEGGGGAELISNYFMKNIIIDILELINQGFLAGKFKLINV